MEEVDKIIIQSLQDIGCLIQDGTESLDCFTTELVIEASARCLDVIIPGSDIPKQLPINMAARFQVGAKIADACKELGYTGDVGYQTFLYSNVTDLRRIFIFLVEKLPRESERVAEPEPDDPLLRLKSEVCWSVRNSLNPRLKLEDVESLPFVADPLESGIIVPRDKLSWSPKEWLDYCANTLRLLPGQTSAQRLLPSVITLNARGLVSRSIRISGSKASSPVVNPLPLPPIPTPRSPKRPTTWLEQQAQIFQGRPPSSASKEQIAIVNSEVAVDDAGREENERIEIEELQLHIDQLLVDLAADSAELNRVRYEYETVEDDLKTRVKEYEALCKALELLPNYEENLKKVDGLISLSNKRYESLNAQWETYREPLEARRDELRSKTANLLNNSDSRTGAAAALKRKLENVVKRIRAKQQSIRLLQEEYDQLPKNIIRSSYTRRILEIIGNIRKQRDEIDKILRDTIDLQRKTNSLFGTIDRLFTVVDETIFRNAKKDEHSKKAYKHLATLHTDCSDIVRMVVETGVIEREIRDLQEQVDHESFKQTADNVARISADMRLLKQENVTLERQLKFCDQNSSGARVPL
ncbi:coiled-coil domain-containing protein 22 homolog [Nesidiocoris tenuis]|uniref:Coiled-coil domain-containing protein 22 homolog n=1 Tax=Nesidiocoris tenuis TaxID=355587 RepID=A0ABN7B5N7_9HEMI|nr:coiled-coil domain-containing protein 22 homolog [Nesidiocoris tenuis]